MTSPSPSTFDHAAPLIVSRIGRSNFYELLLRGLREAVGADHISHLSYDRRGRIRHAAAASLIDQAMIDRTTDLYVNDLYRRDPHYALVQAAAAEGRAVGDVRVLPMTADRIADHEYRRLLFESPGFASKISLLSSFGSRTCYLNLYFSGATPPVGDLHGFLGARAPLLLALAHRHEELDANAPADGSPDEALDSLSRRETQVAALLREGRTAKEVAQALRIAPATVLTYKARLFEKMGVRNLKQFLLM